MDTHNTKRPGSDVTRSTPRKVTFTVKQLLIASGVIIVLFGALLIWKSVTVSNLRKDHATKEAALKQEMSAIYMQQSADYLKRLAKPYVWALRADMLQGGSKQLNLYNNDMVKERGMVSVMVADTKGVVISSTDKKFEGKNVSSFGQADLLSLDSTMVSSRPDSVLIMASPIMSFNSKLGTLIVNYAATPPALLRQ